jgi:hypothetical protein
MSVLSPATEQQAEESLIKEGLLTADRLKDYKTQAEKASTPVLAFSVHEKIISSEQLT